ncbi:GNAT family N-acetyltransferase [Bacillus clarus]|uniref:Acetyltransferase domain protein n=1 Tax=Bacillus clarus TaxID=2338372 RepID=A0A090YX12_9BACI|nr:GNAT family N-acetyltransferase [Bacillus clarus]KFN02578.1 acetyltransferase domain protein [Bacillus clarus]RFT67042.1 GNAT family N-acetyltransferase [Bacillus clarus]
MELKIKDLLTTADIQQMKELAHICGLTDNVDYSSDLHINFLANRKEDQLNDFLFYNNNQLIGTLNMYEFERPTKLELIGFVHPHFRKQKVGTTLLQKAMREIKKRNVDEALLIINGNSLSGRAFAEQIKSPYLYSEYSMAYNKKETNNNFKKNNLKFILASSETLPSLIEIASKAFGDSFINTSEWLQKMISSPTHQVYIALIDEKEIGTITVSKQEHATTLSGFAVHPSHQGQGYGKSILTYMVHTLVTKGHKTIELEVETKNNNALKLYEQCGFEITTKYDYYNLLEYEEAPYV